MAQPASSTRRIPPASEVFGEDGFRQAAGIAVTMLTDSFERQPTIGLSDERFAEILREAYAAYLHQATKPLRDRALGLRPKRLLHRTDRAIVIRVMPIDTRTWLGPDHSGVKFYCQVVKTNPDPRQHEEVIWTPDGRPEKDFLVMLEAELAVGSWAVTGPRVTGAVTQLLGNAADVIRLADAYNKAFLALEGDTDQPELKIAERVRAQLPSKFTRRLNRQITRLQAADDKARAEERIFLRRNY